MMNKEAIEKIHVEHEEWADDLAYWHNEVIYFNNVLLKLLEETEDVGQTEKIEYFKSRFDNLNDKLRDAREKIAAHEKAITFENDTEGNTQLNMAHEQMRWILQEFYKDFRALKNDFYKFADVDCKF